MVEERHNIVVALAPYDCSFKRRMQDNHKLSVYVSNCIEHDPHKNKDYQRYTCCIRKTDYSMLVKSPGMVHSRAHFGSKKRGRKLTKNIKDIDWQTRSRNS